MKTVNTLLNTTVNNVLDARNNEGQFSYIFFYFFTGKNRIAAPKQND